MGWFDDDGYLYLGDRMQDMILVGRLEHLSGRGRGRAPGAPRGASVCVIGLPDDDLGNVVHAIVEADADALPSDELLAFVGERLVALQGAAHRRVRRHEPLRDDAGKVRRAALRKERLGA